MISTLSAVRSRPLACTVRELATDSLWQCLPSAAIGSDIEKLDAWAKGQDNPEQAWQWGTLSLPGIASLATEIHKRLTHGPGFCLVRDLVAEQPRSLQRLVYLAIGTALGNVLENYGRLYDVRDRGVCYKKEVVPISMTCSATGFHTDSSARLVQPDIISLLCLQPGKTGGESRLCSAVTVHNYLAATAPQHLEQLYQPFIRDVVTPGAEKDLSCLRANAFPVFAPTGQFTFRYMRYWIETGHHRAEAPLTTQQLKAFDALDAALEIPEHVHTLRMEQGDQLWVNNRCVAHDRRAYTEYPSQPRTMVRMWVQTATC
ncbi:MAG: TauD/TfdA family dioxygenase [Cyanobacteria bacterium P01_D01_bin.156]